MNTADDYIKNKPNIISSSLNSGHILVGNTIGKAAAVALKGDATLDSTGLLTIVKLTGSSSILNVGANTAYSIIRPNNTTSAGTDFIIQGQNAGGTNQNGGDIKLTPGAASGSGVAGKIQVNGNIKIHGAIYGDENGNVIIQLGQ